jgi:hypothetical protein
MEVLQSLSDPNDWPMLQGMVHPDVVDSLVRPGWVSDGPEGKYPGLAALRDLCQAVRDTPLQKMLIGRWRQARDAAITNDPDAAQKLLTIWAKELVQVPNALPAQRDALRALRKWGSVWKWELLPLHWDYERPVNYDANEMGQNVRYRYSAKARSMVIAEVKQLGIREATGTVVDPAEVVVSAGLAPAGYKQLRDSLKDANALEFVHRLEEWPSSTVNGHLDAEIIQLLSDFCGPDGDETRRLNPAEADNAYEAIMDVLVGLNFSPFEPKTIHEYEAGAVKVIGLRPATTGRVTRVVRPGLRDKNGQLRLPAEVEVE